MKKLVLLCAISGPAYGHAVNVETEFFKQKLAESPETTSVLSFCNLMNLDEKNCAAAMYNNLGEISEVEILAAKKCVEKSGLQYRVAFQKVFKSEDMSLVSNEDPKTKKFHEYYLLDVKEDGKDGDSHRHIWNKYDRHLAGEEGGNKSVASLKANWDSDSVTAKSTASGSTTIFGEIESLFTKIGSSLSLEASKEKSETKSGPPQELINQTYMASYTQNYAYPQYSSVVPSEYCYSKGPCRGLAGEYPNNDGEKRDISTAISDIKPLSIKLPDGQVVTQKEEPKPAEKPLVKNKETDDFLKPVKTETGTGGHDAAEVKEKEKQNKGVSTPVSSEFFIKDMNDCLQREKDAYYEEIGSKTIDPNALTEEEMKKVNAENDLANGICNSSYFGADFCFLYQYQLQSKLVKSEEEKETEYEQALDLFQRTGECQSQYLTEAFCIAAAYALEVTPAEEELNTDRPDELPPNTLPDHISVDSDGFIEGNPWEGTSVPVQ